MCNSRLVHASAFMPAFLLSRSICPVMSINAIRIVDIPVLNSGPPPFFISATSSSLPFSENILASYCVAPFFTVNLEVKAT
jgi:hypothetical protein